MSHDKKSQNPHLSPNPQLPSKKLRLRPLTRLEKLLLSQHPIQSPQPQPQRSPHPSVSLNFLERLLMLDRMRSQSPNAENMDPGSTDWPKELQSSASRSPSPKKNTPSLRTTSHPSSSSDLEQALLALRDLVEVIEPTTDPYFVSAYQQAKTVLRKHEIDPDVRSR
jgi:hypothetical protein